LYAKFEKCEFGVLEVDFLGHRIKKVWKWMTTRWRQFWIGNHLGQFQP
jgi:hypothetical protein